MEKLKLTLVIPLLIFTIHKINSQSNIIYNFSYIINTKTENIDLKKGIEKQLDKVYGKITEHIVNNNDKNIIEDIYINQDIIKTELEISKLKKEMDKKKLQNIITAKEKHQTKTKIDELKKDIQNINNKQKKIAEHFNNLNKLKAKYKKIEDQTNISNLNKEFFIREELFFINYIDLKKIENYYLLEISNVTPEKIETEKAVFKTSSSINEIADKITKHSLKEILGREFLKININIKNNPDAKIYINEKFVSKGIYYDNIFDISKISNKEIEIQITSTNFENYSIKKKVKNADSIILNIDLKRTISKKVAITSNVKSKVFKKGIFIGETPIEIEKPENQDIILLKSNGYKDRFKLINKEEDQVDIEMIKTSKNGLSNVRDKFYVNLAIFTLSTIGTIFAGTLLNNSDALYKITGNHFINKKLAAEDVYIAKAEQMTATFLFGAGITLTIGSFISLITHLVEYIKEANLGE
ncbi:hypothetical protein QIA34_00935 [Borreliella yangtzensis]|uniref:PEGA domain-containing protein n=1 Tax=Borreliella yangtzensis TaxID=683292 RepID=A0ABR6PEN3_9SPIR|nr:hypothetical protein [Borreliella yangtzensis]MBB6043166.1 hypothetical protein [Borreliella yangtzensis]WKC73074.1 hypothetical protein QIA35_00940 [Borreliella yangtzensis]WKC73992.1 hypothetical protein QIA34_00935 [Borreliella yangtzensis]